MTKSVLVIDDDPRICQLICRGFEQKGYSVFQASNGRAGLKIFHAERQSFGSTFKLTLSGFSTSRSDCNAKCGDGIIGAGEECDDGVNDGGYNECQAGCKLGAYCGDGVVDEGEHCDDGNRVDGDGCGSGCRRLIVK